MSATLKRLPTHTTGKSSPSIDAIVSLIITDSHPNDLQRSNDLTCDSLPESSMVHHMTSLARMLVKQATDFSGTCSGNSNSGIILSLRFSEDSVKNIK